MARHPQNAEGKFWIDQDVCIACVVCVAEAPDNVRFDDVASKSYFFKQPETDEEIAAAREAIALCPVEAPRVD